MNDGSIDKYGLSERDIETIRGILMKYPEVLTVNIFGSRALGNYKQGSDVDLAILNEGVDHQTIARIKGDFEESSLPYRVDIVSYLGLDNAKLKDHIDRVGALLYKTGADDRIA